jgi:hypothetical protein
VTDNNLFRDGGPILGGDLGALCLEDWGGIVVVEYCNRVCSLCR